MLVVHPMQIMTDRPNPVGAASADTQDDFYGSL